MKIIRFLLLPFAILYDGITRIRNRQFDSGSKSELEMTPIIISVGNLSTGGTGKTPMVEYLVRKLKVDFSIATISRGYGRNTKGFRIVTDQDSAKSVGDEPFQYYNKFGNDIKVVVGEERTLAVSSTLLEFPNTQAFVLDDAYQHRHIARDFNIMLTEFKKPFFNDWVLPTGNLRESRKGAHRADAIVVTKCPKEITDIQKENYQRNISKYSSAPIFFSKIEYADLVLVLGPDKPIEEEVILVTGIANAKPFISYLSSKYSIKRHFEFADHYHFRDRDLENILKYANTESVSSIVCTEKDMVRLLSMREHSIFSKASLYYVPIEVSIDNEVFFEELLMKALNKE